MPAVLAVARERLRRRRRATLVLIVLAGVSAATPLAVWSASRQADTAVERFVDRANVADLTVFVCPPGYDIEAEADPGPCFSYQADAELDLIRSLEGVEQAGRLAFRPVEAGPSDDPATWQPLSVIDLADGASTATPLGDPIVVSGRLAGPEAPDEVMVTEPAALSLAIAPGDRLWMRSQAAEQPGPTVEATVVGVIRTPADLLPIPFESTGGPPLFGRAGWVEEHAGDLPGFGGFAVWLADGDIEGFLGRLRGRLGDQDVRSDMMLPPGERANLEQATDLESRAIAATAAVTALAATFLVGQAVARQTRSETTDVAVLRALGVTAGQVTAATALRWAPAAAGAAVLATLGALAASALGPVGVARRGPWDRTVRADPAVLGVGAVTVVAVIMLVPVVVAARRRADDSGRAGSAIPPVAVGSVGLRTGIGLAWRSLRRGGALPLASAVGATALAIATVITAAGGAASLRRVTSEPLRFGAPWDALVSSGSGDRTGAPVADIPGVVAAARIAGTDVTVGDQESVWTQGLVAVEGVPVTPAVIVAGRGPVTHDEIALGSLTRARVGVDIGDTVSVQGPAGGARMEFRVVGEAMVTDGFEPNVGHGAVVAWDGLLRLDPSAIETAELGVKVVDGPARAEALAAVREAFPGAQIPFPVPSSLANAERIAELPLFLAMGGAGVAAATLTHALVVSIRRNRRDLAVCRVLGFTRGQVHAAVATHATLLALAASAIGVSLGVAGARWGWRMLAASFGVASTPIVPVWVVAVSVLAALVVANLGAGPSARLSAGVRPAATLRTE